MLICHLPFLNLSEKVKSFSINLNEPIAFAAVNMTILLIKCKAFLDAFFVQVLAVLFVKLARGKFCSQPSGTHFSGCLELSMKDQ